MIPIVPVIIPAGMQARPIIQNHPSDEKCMMDTPAIKRATPERKYAMSVLSFAMSVRSMASSSRRISLLELNLEYGIFHPVYIKAEQYNIPVYIFLNSTTTQSGQQELCNRQ